MPITAAGMTAATRSFDVAAANVVSAGLSTPPASPLVYSGLNVPAIPLQSDLAGAMVDALQVANFYRANLVSFRVRTRIFKSLLDTVA